MKLSRFGLSRRRTKSSIQDRETCVWWPTLLARSRPHVSVRVELEGLLAGGIRKWNGVLDDDPLIMVAVDALCKPQLEPAQLDVMHGVDRLRRRRASRAGGSPAKAFRRPPTGGRASTR
jgi:hypothetical protein